MPSQRFLGSLLVWGVALAFSLYALLHVLRPELNPARRFLSEYAVGPFGLMMTAEFFLQAILASLLVVGLFIHVRRSGSLLAGCLFLSIAAVTSVALGLFPTDPGSTAGGPPLLVTRSGVIHHFTGITSFVSRIAAFLLLARAFTRDDRWRGFSATARALGLAFLVLFFLTIFLTVRYELGGLGQRAAISVGLVWFFAAGLYLRHVPRRSD